MMHILFLQILHKRAAEFIVCKAICHILLKHLVIYNVFRIFFVELRLQGL